MATRSSDAVGDVVWSGDRDRKGFLVVVCGCDASGKTTQVKRLADRLQRAGVPDVVVTRQPTDWYRCDPYIRARLERQPDATQARVMAMFAAADRLRHAQEVLEPALRRGAVVVSDRYVYSSLVYFGLIGVDQRFVATINGGVPRPDIAFLLRMPSADAHRRLLARAGQESDQTNDHQSVAVIESIQQGFDRLHGEFVAVDAERSIDRVHEDMWSATVAAMFARGGAFRANVAI